jgi:GntR family transcriptional regulator of arabinose operon
MKGNNMSRFETIGKSKQFYDFLKNEILNGEYKPGDKFASIRALSEKYEISKITVNSVLSRLVNEGLLYVEQGKGTFISEKAKTALSKRMIGVMLFDFSMENNVEAGIFNSIQMNLKDNYFVIPYNSYNNIENFYKGLKGFTSLEVDGMILLPPSSEEYDPDYIKKLINPDTPIVLINRKIAGLDADFVCVDYEQGMYKGVNHLIKQGKKNIVMIKHDSPSIEIKMESGYRKAHRDNMIPVQYDLILQWPKDLEHLENNLKLMINRMDGLIASDYIIYKIRKVLYESGVKIPQELSIVGFNDTVYSRFMNPPLTAVTHRSEEIGEQALKILTERIEGDKSDRKEIYIVPELLIRSS